MDSRAALLLDVVETMSEGALDWKRGTEVESAFFLACDLMGLDYQTNPDPKGRRWDIRPIGKRWARHLVGREVNIKQWSTAWGFRGTSDVYLQIPWEVLPAGYNVRKVAVIIREWLKRDQYEHTLFLKALTPSIENDMVRSATNYNKRRIYNLFAMTPYFKYTEFGREYDININVREGRITGITIRRFGFNFMRADRPTQRRRTLEFNIVNEKQYIPTSIMSLSPWGE
jgi:hypothetical protein